MSVAGLSFKMGPEIRPKHMEFLWKNVWKTNLILDKNKNLNYHNSVLFGGLISDKPCQLVDVHEKLQSAPRGPCTD